MPRKCWRCIVGLIIVTLLLAEGSLRLTVFRELSLTKYLESQMSNLESVPLPNRNTISNRSGLYQGAGNVQFRTSADRFIEPVPHAPVRYRVLFLGSSTTESATVPESERWVALLNEPGIIGAYNAGLGASNTVNTYNAFRYLTDKGLRFDLVVLMTAQTDLIWEQRFAQVDRKLRVDNYAEALSTYLTKQRYPDLWARISDEIRVLRLLGRVILLTKTALNVPVSQPLDTRQLSLVDIANCTTYAPTIVEYTVAARTNLAMLADAVKATKARFLVISAPHNFRAPAASFANDLRRPHIYCSSDTSLSLGSQAIAFDEINNIYLDSAKAVGAMTFDLAKVLDSDMNGANGGHYSYDGIHFTPAGSELVAKVLRPVLYEQLMGKDF